MNLLLSEQAHGGWRGLTALGEVLMIGAKPDGDVGAYLADFKAAIAHHRANRNAEALRSIEAAIARAPTLIARFNRALILLSLGLWDEGFREYAECEEHEPFVRPVQRQALARGLKPWRGEELDGKRLLLIHDHGFGDTIQALRYVTDLRSRGADVTLLVPPELTRLAAQCAALTTGLVPADFFCPMLLLLALPNSTAPYLSIDAELAAKWRAKYPPGRKRIGVAWDVGRWIDGDYPRAIPLDLLAEQFGGDAELVPVQQTTAEPFEDFADTAALMSVLDEIVTVDTAALHLAGATGHPKITALLSHWHSWRWQRAWYRNVQFLRQPSPGDWLGAFSGVRP